MTVSEDTITIYAAWYSKIWTLSLHSNCQDYNEVKAHLEVWAPNSLEFPTPPAKKKSLTHCQWGGFRLCQIRSALVSGFRTEVSCRVDGLNCPTSKEQYVVSVLFVVWFVTKFERHDKAAHAEFCNSLIYSSHIKNDIRIPLKYSRWNCSTK